MKRQAWNGVAWPKVVKGVCSRHGTRVGPITGICMDCHREQLEAARRGSREFEKAKS